MLRHLLLITLVITITYGRGDGRPEILAEEASGPSNGAPPAPPPEASEESSSTPSATAPPSQTSAPSAPSPQAASSAGQFPDWPSPPTRLRVEWHGDTKAKVSWSWTVETLQNLKTIFDFEFNVSFCEISDDGKSQNEKWVVTNNFSVALHNLKANTTYGVKVVAKDLDSNITGLPSNTAFFDSLECIFTGSNGKPLHVKFTKSINANGKEIRFCKAPEEAPSPPKPIPAAQPPPTLPKTAQPPQPLPTQAPPQPQPPVVSPQQPPPAYVVPTTPPPPVYVAPSSPPTTPPALYGETQQPQPVPLPAAQPPQPQSIPPQTPQPEAPTPPMPMNPQRDDLQIIKQTPPSMESQATSLLQTPSPVSAPASPQNGKQSPRPPASPDLILVPASGGDVTCTHAGAQHKLNEIWKHGSFRYTCVLGGTIKIAGCAIDGSELQIGQSVVKNGQLHRCFREGDLIRHKSLPCGSEGADCSKSGADNNVTIVIVSSTDNATATPATLLNATAPGSNLTSSPSAEACFHEAEPGRFDKREIGEIWTFKNLKFTCKDNGEISAISCITDEGKEISIGHSVVIGNKKHGCRSLKNGGAAYFVDVLFRPSEPSGVTPQPVPNPSPAALPPIPNLVAPVAPNNVPPGGYMTPPHPTPPPAAYDEQALEYPRG